MKTLENKDKTGLDGANDVARYKSEIALCLIPLILSGKAGLSAIAAAADVIAADARFNLWVVQNKYGGKQLGDEGWIQLLEFDEEVIVECQQSLQKFSKCGDHEALVNELQQIASKLDQRRAQGW